MLAGFSMQSDYPSTFIADAATLGCGTTCFGWPQPNPILLSPQQFLLGAVLASLSLCTVSESLCTVSKFTVAFECPAANFCSSLLIDHVAKLAT